VTIGWILTLAGLANDVWSKGPLQCVYGNNNTLLPYPSIDTKWGVFTVVMENGGVKATTSYNDEKIKILFGDSKQAKIKSGASATFAFTLIGLVMSFFGLIGLILHLSGKVFDEVYFPGVMVSIAGASLLIAIVVWAGMSLPHPLVVCTQSSSRSRSCC
jgi:hypothetical protein